MTARKNSSVADWPQSGLGIRIDRCMTGARK
jgi:hypothetical protein